MAEVAPPGGHHRSRPGIDGGDDLVVADRPTRLNEGFDAGSQANFDRIRERIEGIRGAGRANRAIACLGDGEAGRVEPAHLPRADPDQRALTHEHDGV